MSQPTLSLGLVWFDELGEELFAVDDCSAGALSYLANAETVVGCDLSLSMVEQGEERSILKIAPSKPAMPRRVAG